jgi:hypothetical protein
MAHPTRDTTAGRVYNDLRNLARRNNRSTDEVMVEYVLERFLYRLGTSPLGREHFVLKGGLMLAQFGARRTTRDIDILGRAFPGEETEIIRRIAAVAATEIDDGVTFDPATLKTVPIREEDEYHGLRLSMAASIARARLKLSLDVSFGDPVTPGPRTIDYPQQLAAESGGEANRVAAARSVAVAFRRSRTVRPPRVRRGTDVPGDIRCGSFVRSSHAASVRLQVVPAARSARRVGEGVRVRPRRVQRCGACP